ncbi:MAG: serine/threonine-protein kinase, partial [Planctomycetota bacterium]|nr:serine/threonine-protein kinase [Planctomycetota bacterium]
MKPTEYQKLREIFLAVLEREGEEREAHLLEACGDDEKMLAEVRRLLASDQEATRFLELGDDDSSGLSSGDRVGPYTLREAIGEGGFAEVFLAEQQEPVRRRVALKLLKVGMDSREFIARFDAERQALALMQHSGIAKIFDAGISENGRSWFAMEYVDGVPITEFCDTHRLSLAERIDLFIEVCEAIQHAHQKGIIHRDLKPSNILVGMAEGKPLSKVIDFGIAKATGGRLTEKTIFTSRGMLIGTPAYMSPEQAEMSGIDIDTRSDVYSLGILLYELLSGEPPFHPQRLREMGYAEIQRVIREEEPPRPSTKLTTIKTSKKVAELRCLDANALRKQLGGDLDWIAMKALEKNRSRRYATVQELATDLGRHLADEPVEAGPPSASYRFAKFVRRNRAGVAAGSLVLLALAAGIVATTWQRQQARTAERVAVTERDKAQKAELTATQARDEAKKRSEELGIEKRRLEKIVAFQEEVLASLSANEMGLTLMRLFRESIVEQLTENRHDRDRLDDALESFSNLGQHANPTDVAKNLLAEEILAPAVTAIEGDFAQDPLTAASLRAAVAQVYENLGIYDEALLHRRRVLELRRKALGREHYETLEAISELGLLLGQRQGKLDEAAPYLRDVMNSRRQLLGDDHPDTLDSINHMGGLLCAQGELDEAGLFMREALEGRRRTLGDEHHDTLRSLHNMGHLLQQQGKLDRAEAHYREAVEGQRRLLGEEHLYTLNSMNNLGRLLLRRGKLDEADPLQREALVICRRVLGKDHSETLTAVHNMGILLEAQGE